MKPFLSLSSARRSSVRTPASRILHQWPPRVTPYLRGQESHPLASPQARRQSDPTWRSLRRRCTSQHDSRSSGGHRVSKHPLNVWRVHRQGEELSDPFADVCRPTPEGSASSGIALECGRKPFADDGVHEGRVGLSSAHHPATHQVVQLVKQRVPEPGPRECDDPSRPARIHGPDHVTPRHGGTDLTCFRYNLRTRSDTQLDPVREPGRNPRTSPSVESQTSRTTARTSSGNT